MTKSVARKLAHDLDDTLEDVVKALKKVAKEVGADAEETLARAAVALSDTAQALVAEARKEGRGLIKAAKAHPLESATAVTVAAAALIAVIAASRPRKTA